MAGLLTVAQMIGAIGAAAKSAAADVRQATDQIKQDVESTSASFSGKTGASDSDIPTMGASQSSGVVGTNALGAALQITRGRL